MFADPMTKVLTGERINFLLDIICIDLVVPRREYKEVCWGSPLFGFLWRRNLVAR